MANGPEFFQTIMGRAFYEGTMPRLVKQLEKLNENMEKLINLQSKPKDEVEVHAGQKVVLKGVKFLGDKLDPKELANTSESMQPVSFSVATETAEEAFKRAQAHIEKVRLQAISDNEREWVTLCKRTHDPKLAWLERTLSAHGILSRRNGHSFHAPVLEVPADLENKAQLILALVDDMDDDEDPFYVGER